MKRFVFGIVVFLVLFPSLLFSMEIQFKQEAVVDTSMLTLADVAVIRPFSKSQVLSDLVLFPSPAKGTKKCFDSRTLKAYVLDAVINKESIRWTGADTVCIRHEVVSKSACGIQSAINTELQKALKPLSAQRVAFNIRNLPSTPTFKTGKVEYEVSFSDRDILKSRQVNVIIRVDGQVRENLVIAGHVQAFMPVVVATEKMNRGAIIEQDQVQTKVKNIAQLTNAYLDNDKVIGKRLKRSVNINQVITEFDLDLPILVERRQMVTMILQKGSLQISTKGLASQKGKMGDVIMVKNMNSKRQIPCRVVGPGLTVVEF